MQIRIGWRRRGLPPRSQFGVASCFPHCSFLFRFLVIFAPRRLMFATYHNHSKWSDGKATVLEIIAAAQKLGVGELGFSDHWVLHPKSQQFNWAMPTDRLSDYVKEIAGLREQFKLQAAPAIRLGLEVDWHPHNAI